MALKEFQTRVHWDRIRLDVFPASLGEAECIETALIENGSAADLPLLPWRLERESFLEFWAEIGLNDRRNN